MFWNYRGGSRVRHFYFAKKSSEFGREFAIGMVRKSFAHIGKIGLLTLTPSPTAWVYGLREVGGRYHRDKTGTPERFDLRAEDGKVGINLSGKKVDQTALPMQN